jgi:protein phosphatase
MALSFSRYRHGMRVAARSDAGRVREVNEDYVFVDPALGLVIVADGQGGVVTGVLAARLAVESVRQALEQGLPSIDPEQWIHQALVAVDWIVFEAAKSEGQSLDGSLARRLDEHAMEVIEMACARRGTLRDMYATLAMAVILKDELVVARVGHCRAYRVVHASATAVFDVHPRLKEAANMLGTSTVAPDVARIRMLDGERLLLCSDGFHRAVDDAVIAKAGDREALGDAIDALMEEAKVSSTDNIALAILELGGEEFISWRNEPPYQNR